MHDTTRTRFAPSPSGNLHVGGARTALFNWLYARHTGGQFILRIEDTDRQRSTEESVQAIFEALKWMKIDWDEGPHYQSERMQVYQAHIDRLIESGHAYYCTCTPDQIEAMREKARSAGTKPRYDGTCRNKNLSALPNAVVRFKAPPTGNTVIEDAVKGNIVFANDELDDFVVQRSDGSPTYNLAVVVDDITMSITTIIRGDDHVMNTPKQILLYEALSAQLPVFAHVPMVLGDDRTRLSKRHGATSVTAYRDAGQPVLIGGTMGTASYILCGTALGEEKSFSSACHGAGRAMSRRAAKKRWQGNRVIADLASRGILIRSPSLRGVAEEAPGAYKEVSAVVDASDRAGLASKVAKLKPLVCIKG